MSVEQLTRYQHDAVVGKGTLLVSAAAGSGKTKVLVERLLDHVTQEKRDIDEYLIITFTNAAAGELRQRIAKKIAQRLACDPENGHLRRQSLLVYKTQISTIHSFCAKIVRENAHLLNVAPDFGIMDSEDADALLMKAAENVLDLRYETIGEDENFRILVDTLGAGRDDRQLVKVLVDTYRKVRNHVSPEKWMEQIEAGMDRQTEAAEEYLLDMLRLNCDYWLKEYEKYLDMLELDAYISAGYGVALNADRRLLEELDAAAGRGWDSVAAMLPLKHESLKACKKDADENIQKYLKSNRDRFKKFTESLEDWFDCSHEDNVDETGKLKKLTSGLFSVISGVETEYWELKSRRKSVDYGDLEHLTLKLLLDDGGHTHTAKRISEKYREIMVDEYQDTNRIQNAIFSAVSRNGENLFMVGDVKQSIYRFNMADPGIFIKKYNTFADNEDSEAKDGRLILLSDNFRSRPEVTDTINSLFGQLMTGDFGELYYGERERLRPSGTFAKAKGMNTELNVVDVSAMDQEGKKLNKARGEATCVARRIRELIDSGFEVSDGAGRLRPVRAEDVVILMRSPSGRAEEYVRALEAEGLAGTTDAGDDLLCEVEVSVILSYLEIIDNPHQDVHLIGVMRSPLWNFSPEKLAHVRSCSRKSDFYDALRSCREDGEIAEFLDSLEKLRFDTGDMTPSEAVRTIYTRTDALAVFSAMPDGKRRHDNLLKFFRHAVSYEQRGYTTLFAFLSALRRLQERGKKLAAAPSGFDNRVRIMSVHKSKGLEFPVVVLADTMKSFNTDDLNAPVLVHTDAGVSAKIRDNEVKAEYKPATYKALRYRLKQEMLAEELRILYVAMTRPKDKLIIFASEGNLGKKLATLAAMASVPLNKTVLGSVRSMGEWILLYALTRPEADLLRSLAEVKCGVCDTEDSPMVIRVWSGAEKAAPAENEEETESAAEYAPVEIPGTFDYPYEGAWDLPSKITATEIKRRLDCTEKPKRHHARPKFLQKSDKLTGTEKGTAIHLAMQYVDYESCTDTESIEKELDRLVHEEYITQEQRQAVNSTKLLSFFNSGVGAILRDADNVRREFKFSLLAQAQELLGTGGDDRLLLQGVVDCCAEKDGRLTVIDFKSDAITPSEQRTRAESYAPQVNAYALALRRITGMEVERSILYFFATDSWEEV